MIMCVLWQINSETKNKDQRKSGSKQETQQLVHGRCDLTVYGDNDKAKVIRYDHYLVFLKISILFLPVVY